MLDPSDAFVEIVEQKLTLLGPVTRYICYWFMTDRYPLHEQSVETLQYFDNVH